MADGRFPIRSGRPWQVWTAFASAALVLAAAMGWLTRHVWRVDQQRNIARAETLLEQRVSLALWRMDTRLAPLIAEEIARPHLFYDAFITLLQPAAKGVQPALAPSPLLVDKADAVLLNFDVSLDGRWKSPQAPPPAEQPLAISNGVSTAAIELGCARLGELARSIDPAELAAQLPVQPLPAAPQANSSADVRQQAAAAPQRPESQQQDFYQNYSDVTGSPQVAPAEAAPLDAKGADELAVRQQPLPATKKDQAALYADFGQRNTRYQEAARDEYAKQRTANSLFLQNSAMPASAVVENASRPLWVGDRLLLARRVVREGQTFVQGSWLDWPRLKAELLTEIQDLLPSADLLPVRDQREVEPTRVLAGLPVQLAVGDSAAALVAAAPADAPLRWALATGWLALTLAIAAVAALLWGVLALSERRAAFVSSVTHELRTPLTTFRMYAEMLAGDMVPSAERRREYLRTLKGEAERLTHLVENVLAYARLERGRRPQRAERTTPAALAARFAPRLAERAQQAEMQLVCDLDAAAADAPLVTDVGVVEQILFNLVDNAAKYAARVPDRRIELRAFRAGGRVGLAVRDHGPGFRSPRQATRGTAFRKSAQDAADTAAGVGLGLALCRRLARELGGRLEVGGASTGDTAGAEVTLLLPVER